MERWIKGGAIVAALALGGCTLARPLIDREMAEAPHAACAAVNGEHPSLIRARAGAPPQSAAGAPPQCFALAEELPDGRRQSWSGGPLRPGRTLVAIHQAGVDKGCTGRFTHLTVTGASAAASEIELSTWDLVGRPGHMRRHRWERPFGQRTLGLASIDNIIMIPAGVRVRVLDGSFDPASLCFKSY